MNRYVVGFAFSADRQSVLLVRKLRPNWQKGYLNGIGGKIEHGETHSEAMDRECFEETGLQLSWRYRGLMTGTNSDGNLFECHIFYAYENIDSFTQKEDEPLNIYSVPSLQGEKLLDNLNWLIPFGRSSDGAEFMRIEYV